MSVFQKKYFSLFLIFVSVFLFLGNSISQADETKDSSVFRVGMEVNYSPFNWTQSNNKDGAVEIANSKGEYANGYDVVIAERLAKGLNKKLEIIKIEWDGLIPALESKKIDAIVAGMSPTKERRKTIDFSNSYYSSDLVIVIKKDSKYAKAKSIKDFKNARITGQLNTFHYSVIDQIKGVKKQNPQDSFSTMILNTKTNKVDGYVSEKPSALSATMTNKDLTFVEFSKGNGFKTNTDDTSIAVGLRKNSDLTLKINKILSGISQSERDNILKHEISLQNTKKVEENNGFWKGVKDIAINYGPLFLKGAVTTMVLAISSTIIGFIIGLFVAVVRKIEPSKNKSKFKYYLMKVVNFLLACYIEIFRSTPMMVQAILIYYGIPYFLGIETNIMFTALLVVSINTGAYLSEVVRGGINSIEQGQFEACKAIGMTRGQAMINVILPQAIKNIIPSIGNEFVINIKDTSVLNVISVTELFFMGKSVAGTTNEYFETYLIIAIIYFVLTFFTTRILALIEKKMNETRSFKVKENIGGALNE